MAFDTQPKKYTYPSSLLQTSRWDRIRNSWLANAKVWTAPPETESDALTHLVVALVEEVDSRINKSRTTLDGVNGLKRTKRLQDLIKILEKPTLCFFLLNHNGLFWSLIGSLDAHNAHSKIHPGLFEGEIMALEKEILTTVACFGFCRHVFELSERIYATHWQPWLEFSLPSLKPFVPDVYMSVKGHLAYLSLCSAQALRELTTYLLKCSHGIRYIEELSVIHRVGLLLYIVRDADAYQDLLEALQGLLSALCLTKRGMDVVVAAVESKTRWRRSLCRTDFSRDVIAENWIRGKGLLHYAFEVGLTVDPPADDDGHAKRVEDSGRAVFNDGMAVGMEDMQRQEGDETLSIARVHTRVYGAVLCDSLNVLVEAEVLFKKVDNLGQELRGALRDANCENDKSIRRNEVMRKLAKPMLRLAMLCIWEYGREAVYIVGRHLGSLDYITRIARYIGDEYERYTWRFSEDHPHLYHATRIVYDDMASMGRAFEPLMTMHPDCDAHLIPQLLLLGDVRGRLTNMEEQIRLLCAVIDKPHKLPDPEFISHLETAINSMAISSMHSAIYLKALFTKCVEMNTNMSLPALLSIALNEVIKVAYLTSTISPPPRNYVPGSSYGLKVNKAPTYDVALYEHGPTVENDKVHPRRNLINKRTAALRLVCSLAVLLRRTAKCLYGNTSSACKGVMNLGEAAHDVSDDIIEGPVTATKEPFDNWFDYFSIKIAQLKEGSLENAIGEQFATIAEDKFKQWTVGRVVFEALLNAYSISADKTLLRNKPLVELVEVVCAASIKLLLEYTLVEDREGKTTLQPKYLGRNGAFYLLAHIVQDSVYQHRVSPLESNAKLLQEVMPSTFLAETPTPGNKIISSPAAKYWTAKLKLLGPSLGKLLELWIAFRVPTGIKLVDHLSSLVDCTSLKLDISNTHSVPMKLSRIVEWVFGNRHNIPKAVWEGRRATAVNIAATAIQENARNDTADYNLPVHKLTTYATSALSKPVSNQTNNLRVGWRSRQPTPQQIQQRRPRLRALPKASGPVGQEASHVAPAITVTPASPGPPHGQPESTLVASSTPSDPISPGQDSDQLAGPIIPTAPRNFNFPSKGSKQLATPTIPTAPRNFIPPRPRNGPPTSPRNFMPPARNRGVYYSCKSSPTTSTTPATQTTPANQSRQAIPSRPVRFSNRSVGVDQFQRAHEHRGRLQVHDQEQREPRNYEKWEKADETDTWKFHDPSRT